MYSKYCTGNRDWETLKQVLKENATKRYHAETRLKLTFLWLSAALLTFVQANNSRIIHDHND